MLRHEGLEKYLMLSIAIASAAGMNACSSRSAYRLSRAVRPAQPPHLSHGLYGLATRSLTFQMSRYEWNGIALLGQATPMAYSERHVAVVMIISTGG